MMIVIKRAYDQPTAGDGYRVLVDRLWPRGVRKESLALDEWCKDIAPSSELRKWFGHDSERLEEFRASYVAELDTSDVPHELLKRAEAHDKLTLIYAAKDPTVNHAVILQEYLDHKA